MSTHYLNADTARCTDQNCPLHCRRKEPPPPSATWVRFSAFELDEDGNCQYRIEPV